MKLYVLKVWNSDNNCFDFEGHICAKNEKLAEQIAKKEWLDEEINVYEVKVKGYKIIVEGVEK